MKNIEILATAGDLARAAAEVFVARSSEAVAQRGSWTIALSGGSTPKLLYQLLADPNEPFRERVPWSRIHFFWSDERHVPPDHPDSNYRMANEAMLAHVQIGKENVHRVMSENPSAAEAAELYEEVVPQRFDLILLGLGTDGHTASIFPGSEVLHETKRLVAAPWVEKLKAYRITMTLPLINNAAAVVFLVSGAEKAEIVNEVLRGPKRYPAQEVRPAEELRWLLDREAASKL
ncbi:MAG TPA: 6-phosphogluconolactonase [Pyrinomonadaceae bacterium]|nr:6-phosphogluconolactonase [Pyrinomonadaceae bacterium]